MTNEIVGESRLLRSAHALKAFFEKQLQMPLEFLTEAPAEADQNDMEFGWATGALGLWGLRASASLTEDARSEMYETFKTILGSVENLRTQRDQLMYHEQKLNENFEELPSNVIPLRRPGLRSGTLEAPRKRWTLRLDCLIEAPYLSEVHKMAFELHSQSARYAFLEYRDLDSRIRLTPSELLSMGAITLFIPDVLDLSRAEQQVLRHIAEQDTLNRPLLMVGSTLPYAQLRLDPTVDTEFLSLLSRAYIKLTRPFAEYKEQGLIQYFLDSLSVNPS